MPHLSFFYNSRLPAGPKIRIKLAFFVKNHTFDAICKNSCRYIVSRRVGANEANQQKELILTPGAYNGTAETAHTRR